MPDFNTAVDIRQAIAAKLRAGVPQIRIARELDVDAATVRRIGDAEGLPRPSRGTPPTHASIEDAFRAGIEPGPDGHVLWTGYTDAGLPMVFHVQQRVPAPKVAFRLHTGRDPIGRITRTCDMQRCVAGGHLADQPMRQANKRADTAYAAIFGGAL
jgi:hypothetical protein